nr:hypothetical protein [uncultured Desulfobulbus sp.]
MYLRTTKRKNKNGTVTEYLQLAHNERNPETNSTVARIIHSFGRADQLDREALVRLARSIARVCGVTIVDPAGSEEAQGGGLPDDLEILRTVELNAVDLRVSRCKNHQPSEFTIYLQTRQCYHSRNQLIFRQKIKFKRTLAMKLQ